MVIHIRSYPTGFHPIDGVHTLVRGVLTPRCILSPLRGYCRPVLRNLPDRFSGHQRASIGVEQENPRYLRYLREIFSSRCFCMKGFLDSAPLRSK